MVLRTWSPIVDSDMARKEDILDLDPVYTRTQINPLVRIHFGSVPIFASIYTGSDPNQYSVYTGNWTGTVLMKYVI